MNTSATAFDAFSGMASAALYLLVGLAAFAATPRDARARTFLAVAVSSVVPYIVPAVIWLKGSDMAMALPVVTGTGLSLAVGSLALFHFMQVFPSRRPWIRAHGRWVIAGYAVLPLVAVIATIAALPLFSAAAQIASTGDGGLGSVTLDPIESLAAIALLIPSVLVVGVLLPFTGLLSLYKSWQEAKAAGSEGARVTTLWILISQLAGGVLTILIIPLLHLVLPSGPWVAIASALLFGFGLLMPIAFAMGVWKYRLLESGLS
jgi:hypothetical protein